MAKKVLILFLLSWVVSNFFEFLSIATGFPFGHYHYAEWLGPMLAKVPLFIMPTYFAMGYLSWIIANILLRQYDTKLKGVNVFLVPFVVSFVMVMWDLVMDTLNSTLSGMWTWEEVGTPKQLPPFRLTRKKDEKAGRLDHRFSSPHLAISRKAGSSFLPFSVREYST